MDDKAIAQAVSAFGKAATARLSNPVATGEPEDQLRGPFENLLQQLALLCGFKPGAVVAVGESSIADLKTRPDYAITVGGALLGFIELKAPGKGGDPRRFKTGHDKAQWQRLQSMPNLIYSDGNEFSLWRSGELATAVVRLGGDVETSGAALSTGPGLLALFDFFLQWQPIPPRSAKELAEVTARLCRLLRDQVIEALEQEASRTADDRRPPQAFAAGRHPARHLAGRIHDRVAQCPQCAGLAPKAMCQQHRQPSSP